MAVVPALGGLDITTITTHRKPVNLIRCKHVSEMEPDFPGQRASFWEREVLRRCTLRSWPQAVRFLRKRSCTAIFLSHLLPLFHPSIHFISISFYLPVYLLACLPVCASTPIPSPTFHTRTLTQSSEFYAVKQIHLADEDDEEDEWLSANAITQNGAGDVTGEMEDTSWESVEGATVALHKTGAVNGYGKAAAADESDPLASFSRNSTRDIEYYKPIGADATVSTASGASISNRARAGVSKCGSAQKMNPPGKDTLEKLQVEVELMKDLKHANIVRYYGAEVTGLTLNIFMEVSVIEKE